MFDVLTIKTTSEIWLSMKDVGSSMGGKNISDLVLKEIYGICETKNPTKKQVNEYKMTKREIYKKFTNLSKKKKKKKKKLITQNKKIPYIRNDVRGVKAIDGFRKKLMVLYSEIFVCPEFEVKSKTGKIFKKHNLIEKYSVKIYELILIFVNIIKKN